MRQVVLRNKLRGENVKGRGMWLLTALLGNTRVDAQLLSMAANREGTVAEVRQLLADGANPNALDYRDEARGGYEGQTALHYAASWREPDRGDLVRLLLKKGANPSTGSRFGHTPLHYFALYGCVAEIGELLDAGAKVNAFNKIGHTPLHYAAANAQVEAARVLLERGADPNAQKEKKTNPGCETPILTAVSFHRNINIEARLEVMKLLIRKGARLTNIGDGTETPLDAAKGWLQGEKQNPEEEDRQRSVTNLERMISLLERESSSVGNGILRN